MRCLAVRGAPLPLAPLAASHSVPLAQSVRAAGVAAARARSALPLLYGGKGGEEKGDASKCPFFGGPNGGGLGDANIATGALFVLAIFVLNRLIVRAAAIGPQRLAMLTARAAHSLARSLGCWLAVAWRGAAVDGLARFHGG